MRMRSCHADCHSDHLHKLPMPCARAGLGDGAASAPLGCCSSDAPAWLQGWERVEAKGPHLVLAAGWGAWGALCAAARGCAAAAHATRMWRLLACTALAANAAAAAGVRQRGSSWSDVPLVTQQQQAPCDAAFQGTCVMSEHWLATRSPQGLQERASVCLCLSVAVFIM